MTRLNRGSAACVSLVALALALAACGSAEPVEVVDDEMPENAGDTFAVTEDWQLVSFDRAAPALMKSGVKMRGPTPIELPIGLDFRPANRKLYVVTSTARLFSINLRTGNTHLVGTLFADPADTTAPFTGLSGTSFGVDFNPVVDRLRIVSDSGQNLRVDPDTGATTTDAARNGAASGGTAAAYTQSFAAACRTSLYVIDTTSDTLLIQSPPNDGVLTAVGPLGVDAEDFNAFDIVTGDDGQDVGLAVLSVDGELAFYLIDLTSGAASFLSRADILTTLALVIASVPPRDAPPQAPGELYGVTAKNRLVTFNRAAPSKLCTSARIEGLRDGEEVVGIDFRPSTGALHALTSASRLYVVDPATAFAQGGVSLSVPLEGSEFGVDFNPTGPVALRIVSNTGQNLRVVDPTTGATMRDAALNPGTPAVTGAAYTNSLPLAGTTTLYVIDSAADRLFIQSPPNDGTLVGVGALGSDVGNVDGFNIDGRNGVALLAQSPAGGRASTLHTIDLITGTLSASLGTIGGGERLRGLTQPTPMTTVYGATTDNQLVTLGIAGAAVSSTPVGPISGLMPDESVLGLDFRPSDGRLYALTATRIYTIDPDSGAASLRSMLAADPADATSPFTALTGTSFGVDFNPTGPVAMRVVSDAEENLRIPSVATGLVVTDTTLAGAPTPFAVTAAAYSNSFAGATATTLYVIDTLGDRLMVQNPPNAGALRPVGALGIDATEINGFEIIGADLAVASLRTAAGARSLYSINLATGAATTIGALGCATFVLDDVRGLSAEPTMTAPAADSPIYAVNGTTLVRFPRNGPDLASVVGPITGLVAGETVVGIDFRPANGQLYLVTSAGRVLTVDKGTAAATEVAHLNDSAGNPVALSGTAFGVDFNPVADRLRIVSDTNQNLRVVPDGVAGLVAGMTFVDGALNAPGPDVVAAAYTRSFAGSTATSLYVIDASSGALMLQNPPNDGLLTRVGALSPSLTIAAPAGFDIAGGHDGVVLAALRAAGATQSTLYRVNLTTGAATAIGPIGDPAGPLIGSLAIRVQ